jgi:hypothetical protein
MNLRMSKKSKSKSPRAAKPGPRHLPLLPDSLTLHLCKDGTFLQFETEDGRGAAINLDCVFDRLNIALETYTIWNRDIRRAKGLK